MKAGNIYIKPILRQGCLAALAGSILLLSGCSSTPSSERAPHKFIAPTVSPTVQPAVESDSKTTLCNKELQALKGINAAEYSRYRSEMDHLVSSGQRYMNVKGEISNDINDILTPRYQFGMANLCWKIRNALSQSLLTEANAPQERKP